MRHCLSLLLILLLFPLSGYAQLGSTEEPANNKGGGHHRYRSREGSTEQNRPAIVPPSRRGTRRETPFSPTGSGSGFAVGSDGMVATCYHVVKGSSRIRVRGINGNLSETAWATIVSIDAEHDLALLKIDVPANNHGVPIPYGIDRRQASVGEDIFVLGYPLRTVMGDELKLTSGVISSRSGYMGDTSLYQISASVQPGNSGCPVFNKEGNIIGVVGARLQNVEDVTYAIKSSFLGQLDAMPNIGPKHQLRDLPLPKKVEAIRNFIYIIEVEE